MARIHGNWGHYVRPGQTDPARYGSHYYTWHDRDDPPWLDAGQIAVFDLEEDDSFSTSYGQATRKDGRPWTDEEDELIYRWYPIYGSKIGRWPQRPKGRDKQSVDNRARELGLWYRGGRTANNGGASTGPSKGGAKRRETYTQARPRTTRRQKTTKHEEQRNRAWTLQEDAILRRMYPVYGPNMTSWPEKLYCRKKKAIEQRAHELGLDSPT